MARTARTLFRMVRFRRSTRANCAISRTARATRCSMARSATASAPIRRSAIHVAIATTRDRKVIRRDCCPHCVPRHQLSNSPHAGRLELAWLSVARRFDLAERFQHAAATEQTVLPAEWRMVGTRHAGQQLPSGRRERLSRRWQHSLCHRVRRRRCLDELRHHGRRRKHAVAVIDLPPPASCFPNPCPKPLPCLTVVSPRSVSRSPH